MMIIIDLFFLRLRASVAWITELYSVAGCRVSRVKYRAFLVGAILSVLLLAASSSFAQVPGAEITSSAETAKELELTRRANSIARQTMSPFCPGRTLADCPSPNAAAWRADIRELLAAGRSAAAIQKEFERRTGGDLSGIPHRGVSYTFPIALTIGAAALLLLVFSGMLRRKSSRQASKGHKKEVESEQAALPEVSDERLAEELENLD